MLQRLRHFLWYNNAIPILLGVLFLSSGVVLAADEDVRRAVGDAVITEDAQVVSIDNTYLLETDFDTYTPQLLITDVREDDEQYYVSYTLETIDLVDYVWQPTLKEMVLVVAKDSLGGRDLGLRVTRELKEVVEGQIALLKETQEIEHAQGASRKVVATVYQGLVGRYFDSTLEEFPGYTPVIEEVVPNLEEDDSSVPTPTPDEASRLAIQLLGGNPIELQIGDSYVELGAVTTLNGAITSDPIITISGIVDTATAGRYTLRYKAVFQNLSAEATRVIVVRGNNGTGNASSTPDITAPVLSLNGEAALEMLVGAAYTESGATAFDDIDGDLTQFISVAGTVDTSTVGVYTITYTVSDAAGNSALTQRAITVTLPAEVAPQDIPDTNPPQVSEPEVTPPEQSEPEPELPPQSSEPV